ncbi:dihydrofolate synthase/folylpolyglutamate synthase [Scopulibacillus darangshiensis]|uniref:Dihydrofolate synthase/folylpolyglutamate synthase n=2 Tax=Scopulibacillus darangshiensis TaxID=442528 RepID=A0A4R2PAV9_9BACL|nr:folylpolyglutamate synthase/dihydrofolate synthase family protein [Scopulibacillus darangshiensis]TCP32229.1 dihydrofolate synthase/folylpolyglutamate synthase [Scopulibacillus darangshiensis]
MLSTIEETLSWIHDLLPHGIKPGTTRMEWMLQQLDHPERKLRTIHVAGTNGKGSTVSFLKHIYQKAGYTIGTFTSPYLTHFNERIAVNGEWISDEDLIKAANIVYPLVKELEDSDMGTPTEFEVVTMLSFVYFAKIKRCDLVIYEVGLGGRLDSTNVITPLVSIITSIGMDHMAQLGDTIQSIASEKAGIIKSGVPVITAVEQAPALEVIRQKAKEKQAKLYEFGKEIKIDTGEFSEDFQAFDCHTVFHHHDNLKIGLIGAHQLRNAACALMAVDVLNMYFAVWVDEADILAGLEDTVWPGRFEAVSQTPKIVLDGAHNPEGSEALASAMNRYYKGKDVTTIFASLADKNNDAMTRNIAGISSKMVFTTFDFPRAALPDDLYSLCDHTNKESNENWKEAIDQARAQTSKDGVILITGSLYFISEARQYLLKSEKPLS